MQIILGYKNLINVYLNEIGNTSSLKQNHIAVE